MTGYLTLAETAKVLRVSPRQVRILCERSGLPVIRLSPRRYLVSEEGLREWLDSRVVSGAQAASTRSGAASTGASASRLPRLASDDAARSGSSARRRPPAASSKRSSADSLVAFPPRKAE